MARYIPDTKTERWVIIATHRQERPEGIKQSDGCPFCAGNERMTPPEVFRNGSGQANGPGWQVRVVPNLFPITDIHEVIIHSPDHGKDIEDLKVEEVFAILDTYRHRYREHAADGQVIIFCNHQLQAGASIPHPHSQLVVIPRQITLDELFCEPLANVISESLHFTRYCPDFSQWPYETWIVPKSKGEPYYELSDDVLRDLSVMMQQSIQAIRKVYDDPVTGKIRGDNPFGYNYYISSEQEWFIRIIPRFIHRAGFELGTGLSVNIVDPGMAAETLKRIPE